MNPTRRKLRRISDIQRRRSALGVAARERNRMAQSQTDPGWQRVASLLLTVHAAPDWRNMAICCYGLREWYRCGTERAVRGALARMMYKTRKATP